MVLGVGDRLLNLSLAYNRRHIDLVLKPVRTSVSIHLTSLGVTQLSLKRLNKLVQVPNLTLKHNKLLGLEERRCLFSIMLGLVFGVKGLRNLIQEVEAFCGLLTRCSWS